MKKIIKIGDKFIGKGYPVFVMAEAGVNHNGKLDLALKLVDAAADAGADAIKFQTFRAEEVVIAEGEMAEYQKKNTGKNQSQLAMLKKLEFQEEWYPKVIKRCKERGIIFLSTPHGGFASVDLLNKFKVPALKFGSGDLNNLPVLEYAARLNKPIILSTGMGNMEEIKEAVKTISKKGNDNLIVLHCTTNYPCPLEEVNLNAMKTIEKEVGVMTGYSDHTAGYDTAVMAVVMGAPLIEKHLTLDKKMNGPDHKASADPKEFKEMVMKIRNVGIVMGQGKKEPTVSELKMLPLVRKSVVTLSDIKKGDLFTALNIGIKRPGTGLAPKYHTELIGSKSKKDIKAGTLLD
ncbi:MAG: N-acetylneuraminate synthase [Candidatus Yanofskybacteria bacterium GW2011_GWA2_44_9]|uniref:N-acetylneuraminate synthase n=1 Tax=Candidatus Yanofskybacteria bacterium GW2011_GWA2_44_9 TaxID=1619025 RepID=A0A0G1MKV4_9BACT|nr:MAG: N-acetylneuraminate synthase [Candidatus Yanofskybacteria bacterium GW2011_GWA2_44_9]